MFINYYLMACDNLDEIVLELKGLDKVNVDFDFLCSKLENIYLRLESLEKQYCGNEKFEAAYELFVNIQAKYVPECF
jgi:hypothetical protein